MKYFKAYGVLLIFLLVTIGIFLPIYQPLEVLRKNIRALPHNSFIHTSQKSSSIVSYDLFKMVDRDENRIYDSLDDLIIKHPYDKVSLIILLKKLDDRTLEFFRSLGGEITGVYDNAIVGFSGKIIANRIPLLLRDENILFIQPNLRHKATMQNALRLIRVRPYVWSFYNYMGPTNMSIAVIDSGIDIMHPMLSNVHIVGWFDAVNNKTIPYDDNGHGTIIAGIIGGAFYDGKVIGEKTAIRFEEFALVVDGLEAGTNITYSWWTYFPVFKAGEVNITIYWKDISIETDKVKGHKARISGFDIYLPNGTVEHFESRGNPLSYIFNAPTSGSYYMEIYIEMFSNGTDEDAIDGPGIAFWAYAIQEVLSPDTYEPFAGVVPFAKIVGVKVLDAEGFGATEDIIAGIEWVIENRIKYHIVVATITFGSSTVDPLIEYAVKNLVKSGIVVIAAAGNDGPQRNSISSPGRLDYVITVGASTDGWTILNVTDWSSRGPYGMYSAGTPATTNTTKPDIVAPGGSFHEPSLICVDMNISDNLEIYYYNVERGTFEYIGMTENISDIIPNDFVIARGTSMSTAYVGGGALLLIQALTNDSWEKWKYDLSEVLKIKQLLLMTAWEIYKGPETNYRFNRGEKDIVEGYGLIQVDAAIDAVKRILKMNMSYTDYLSNETFQRHVWAGKVYLEANTTYLFRLEVPSDADMDIYLWDQNPNDWGEPILLAKSTKSAGKEEYFAYTPEKPGYYYVTVKIVSGEGKFNLTIINLSNEELEEIIIRPPKGIIVEKKEISVYVKVHVSWTYVISVEMRYNDHQIAFSAISVSEDGRVSEWLGNITLQTFSFKGELLIKTPVKTFVIQYSLTYIPYFKAILVGVSAVCLAGIAFFGYHWYRKKKLERLARIEEEAKEIAKETIEEVLEEK
mgnify:CR=1 FL=1